MKQLILAFLIALVLPTTACCEQLSPAQPTSLKHYLSAINVVKELADEGIITSEQEAKADSLYCGRAGRLIGRTPTVSELTSLAAHSDESQGFGIFLNTVIIFAGIALLLSAIGLIVYYLWDFLKSLPAQVYEGASYLATFFLLASGLIPRFNIWFVGVDPIWFVVPGAFAFAACVYFTYWLHWLKPRKNQITNAQWDHHFRVGPATVNFPTVLAGLCTIVWATTAIGYHQLNAVAGVPYFLAFIAIMALQSFFGFSLVTLPRVIYIGWLENKQVPRSTLSSFILLVFYIAIRLSGEHSPEYLKLFESGGLFMGAFVFYLGLLVMSNKWYHMQNQAAAGPARTRTFSRGSYLVMQAITVVSGLLAFYIGNIFHFGSLLGIGGTFFTLYLLEKYYEIPWKGVGWAWSLLGVAAFMYFFVGFAGQNPQYFIWGIR